MERKDRAAGRKLLVTVGCQQKQGVPAKVEEQAATYRWRRASLRLLPPWSSLPSSLGREAEVRRAQKVWLAK